MHTVPLMWMGLVWNFRPHSFITIFIFYYGYFSSFFSFSLSPNDENFLAKTKKTYKNLLLFPYKLVIGKTSHENVQDTPPHTNATLINTNLITPTHNENIINTPNNPHMNFPQVSRNVSNERGANNRGNWLTGLRIMWRRVRTMLSRDTPHSRLQKSTNPRRERYLHKGNWSLR